MVSKLIKLGGLEGLVHLVFINILKEDFIMNKNLFVFVSSINDDVVSRIVILATSIKRAYVLAMRYFRNNNCEGLPRLLAI